MEVNFDVVLKCLCLFVCVCMCVLSLTLEQKELCRSRLKLLSYLDRLATYEVTTVTHPFCSSSLDQLVEISHIIVTVDSPK